MIRKALIYDYSFKENYIELEGNRLHYLDEGRGPTVVLVHGNPTWSYYFRNIVKTLSSHFRVIVPDHMGCGLSDKPQDYNYTLDNHIANLEILIKHLEISELSMVVHDWGGAIGLGYAIKYIDKIQSLVVLNTAAFRSKKIPLRISLCRLPVIGKFIVQGLNGFAWPATFMAVCRKMKKDVSKAYLIPYNNWNNRIAVYRFVRDIPLNQNHVSYKTLKKIEENLPRLKEKNILIAWGGKDFCFNDHFYDEWKKRFPDAQCHYFENSGHYILEDEMGTIEPLIDNFLVQHSD